MQFQQPPPPPGQQQQQAQSAPQQQAPPQASQQALAQSPYQLQIIQHMAYQQPRFIYNPAAAVYPGPGVATPFSTQAQPVVGTSYSQPPPTMPNQVSQQRPQTPPNPAAIGIPGAHTIINY